MSESEKPGIEVIELEKLGNTLPIGVIKGGKVDKSFSLKPLKGAEEREIGKWKGENENAPITKVVSKVLSVLLDTLGGEAFQSGTGKGAVEEEKALQKIGRLYAPDVWGMYTVARYANFGSEYAIPFECPNPACELHGKEVKIVSDIGKIDFHVVRDLKLLQTHVRLHHGLEHRGALRKSFTVTPILWASMVAPEFIQCMGNENLFKLYHIQKCVTGIEGVDGPVMLTSQDVDNLLKMDIEKIYKVINEVNIGPVMKAEGECKCGFKFTVPLNWEYDHFFGASSLY
jgi:hypothetical protein